MKIGGKKAKQGRREKKRRNGENGGNIENKIFIAGSLRICAVWPCGSLNRVDFRAGNR